EATCGLRRSHTAQDSHKRAASTRQRARCSSATRSMRLRSVLLRNRAATAGCSCGIRRPVLVSGAAQLGYRRGRITLERPARRRALARGPGRGAARLLLLAYPNHAAVGRHRGVEDELEQHPGPGTVRFEAVVILGRDLLQLGQVAPRDPGEVVMLV